MVNIFKLLHPLVNGVMKLAGLASNLVEIEAGTVLNIWVPTDTLTKTANNKPVVVFIHGFALNGILTWLFQAMLLSDTYSVYVPDVLFFGGSTTDKLDRTPAFQADCVAKGLHKLGVKKCTVVGLSYGGIIGFKMAQNYPDLVECMVGCGTVIDLTKSITAGLLARTGAGGSSLSGFLLPESVEGVIELLTASLHKLPWFPRFAYKHYLQIMFDNRKERGELLAALVVSDEDSFLPKYTQRIHLLWGKEDKFLNMEVAQNLKEELGDGTNLEYIERAGHLLQLERPFQFNRQLKKIIASLPPQHKYCITSNLDTK